MLSIGFERCKLDECIYLLSNVHILVYVDDILIIGQDEKMVKEVTEKLKCSFQCRDLGIASSFLGLEIDHDIEAAQKIDIFSKYFSSSNRHFSLRW